MFKNRRGTGHRAQMKNYAKSIAKNQNGITLIALVITIIVLLILAGISLSLIMGEGGILKRAVNARKTNDIAGVREKVELEFADYLQEYLTKRYVNQDSTVGANMGEYILGKLPINGDGYTVTRGTGEEANKITITLTDGTTTTGTIDSSSGKVAWEGVNTNGTPSGGGSGSGSTNTATNTSTNTTSNTTSNTTENTTGGGSTSGTPAGTAIADNTHYGDYFDLGTSIFTLSNVTLEDSTHPAADWRIFSKDSTGVWLILSDYYPASANSSFITSTIGLSLGSNTSTYPYSVRSTTSRADLMTRLRNDWKGILPSSLQSNSNITAVGALTVTEWQAGWNSKYTGTEQIAVSGDETNGYSYLDISSKAGYSNTLYFPHKSAVSNCYGYRLASPYAGSSGEVLRMYYLGYVNNYYYGSDYCGVRPAVHLASDINIEQDSTTNVWSISN